MHQSFERGLASLYASLHEKVFLPRLRRGKKNYLWYFSPPMIVAAR
jgi:hypothetical protein